MTKFFPIYSVPVRSSDTYVHLIRAVLLEYSMCPYNLCLATTPQQEQVLAELKEYARKEPRHQDYKVEMVIEYFFSKLIGVLFLPTTNWLHQLIKCRRFDCWAAVFRTDIDAGTGKNREIVYSYIPETKP